MESIPRAPELSQVAVPYMASGYSDTFREKGEVSDMDFPLIYTLNIVKKKYV